MPRRGALCMPLSLIAVLVAAGALLLSACAVAPPPALTASVPDAAADVPLDAPLGVTATGAVLQRVRLERLDVPTTVASLEPAESPARLDAALLPDARYR